jgi:hypothetical protein
VEETAEPLVLIGRGWETRWRFYEGGIVGGGESRSVGSPGQTRSGAGRAGGKLGLGGWGLCICELKCTQVHFSVVVYIYIYYIIFHDDIQMRAD